ncbi:MAG TPA: Ppx/GppA phosphatase family protein [Gaiellaceae bacterium]|jgi:exopolyphosphatase / guanosine-5'-triphosphate,3'-diphosphate pyrophosphatase
MRVAAIDQGTNTTRLLVADVADGEVEEVAKRLQITRLGEGVDARRRLLPLPIARVRNVLSDYRREAEALGAERVLLTATSAVRDAENGEAFLGEIEWSYGFATRLLSGEEEAELTFRGAANGLPGSTLVVDPGGGSTEFVRGEDGLVEARVSVDLGSVRLTERYLRDDPPRPEQLVTAAIRVRASLPELEPADRAVGVAGTITTLAALDLGLEEPEGLGTHGHRLTLDAVRAQRRRLAAVPLDERRRIPGLHPDRAPVIVAGAVLVEQVIEGLGLDSLEVSERDILHGAALEAAELPAPVEGAAPPGAYTCC